jgi:hypothetical protein
MVDIICVRVVWDRKAIELGQLPARLHTLHIGPEPGYPFGRKGLALASAWSQLQMSNEAGMLLLDGDVAIDPYDLGLMLGSIDTEPGAVHTAPVRLWPRSTMRDDWHWAHHRGQPSQEHCPDPLYFSFSFTYLPRKLLAACVRAGMRRWTFPTCDARVSATAKDSHVPVRVVENCQPKHLHY